jgi:hypothetical protein
MAMLNNQRVYQFWSYAILGVQQFSQPMNFQRDNSSMILMEMQPNLQQSWLFVDISRNKKSVSIYTKLSITSFPLFWLFPQYLG